MKDSKQLTENVENATDVAPKENTVSQKQPADVKFQKETKDTLANLEAKNKNMSEQISNLIQEIRTISAPKPSEPIDDQGEVVWDRIRKYQADLKGIKIKLDK